ncbi:MAG: polymer-forming cytoskeletal protein [Betaproteobacteria bacterium]|jgi:cytoskeletal protein CcmA (bactofilin family)|nr:polymer-forming cytoskeletal protein [Betaproteobacteria bacterium]
MFGNSKDKSLSSNQERFDTLIGRTTEIVGRLVLLDSVRVDGKVHGSIESQADRNITVAIGPTGEVTGDIRANRVIVAGRVQGNIEASERAELQKDCVVMGDISYGSIAVEHGARMLGTLAQNAQAASSAQDAKSAIQAAQILAKS